MSEELTVEGLEKEIDNLHIDIDQLVNGWMCELGEWHKGREELQKEVGTSKGIIKELLDVYVLNLDGDGKIITPLNEVLDLINRSSELLKTKKG